MKPSVLLVPEYLIQIYNFRRTKLKLDDTKVKAAKHIYSVAHKDPATTIQVVYILYQMMPFLISLLISLPGHSGFEISCHLLKNFKVGSSRKSQNSKLFTLLYASKCKQNLIFPLFSDLQLPYDSPKYPNSAPKVEIQQMQVQKLWKDQYCNLHSQSHRQLRVRKQLDQFQFLTLLKTF